LWAFFVLQWVDVLGVFVFVVWFEDDDFGVCVVGGVECVWWVGYWFDCDIVVL